MTMSSTAHFDRQYQTHFKHLKLKGLQPKTTDAYTSAIRRMGMYFSYQINDLSEAQLIDYFSDLIVQKRGSCLPLPTDSPATRTTRTGDLAISR